ncbi:hypothetical protein LMG7974_01781 [Campylobacter majalis]|uniref:YgjP-like metallopeptidase domain-containing protein n=1 Tax=Campylobacter majalis TaxID=2790656 RepID=A0ABM8QAA6_9BACT|nr:SprT family zinc-dependent metalloprotease [Campylobacter majalis]CAD7289703.1 hypothetical protein LMG7974_01781 [Campylobacter majalis]
MAIKTFSLNFEDIIINVSLKPRVKYMRLKVKNSDASVSICAPYRTSKQDVIEFVKTNANWLRKTYETVKSKQLKDDEVMYLGKLYRLKIDDNFIKVQIINDEILVSSMRDFDKFKRQKAKEILGDLVMKFKPLIDKKINKISINSAKTRWGSCNYKKGYINFSIRLLGKDLSLIEYVVLHELTHLIYPNHSKQFYDFIANIMPDFRLKERLLKG